MIQSGITWETKWFLCGYLDDINWGGETCPLWMAPFPRQKVLHWVERVSWAERACIHCLLLTPWHSSVRMDWSLTLSPNKPRFPHIAFVFYHSNRKRNQDIKVCLEVFPTPCLFTDLKFKFWTWSLGLPDFWDQEMNTSLCSSEACISFVWLFCLFVFAQAPRCFPFVTPSL